MLPHFRAEDFVQSIVEEQVLVLFDSEDDLSQLLNTAIQCPRAWWLASLSILEFCHRHVVLELELDVIQADSASLLLPPLSQCVGA